MNRPALPVRRERLPQQPQPHHQSAQRRPRPAREPPATAQLSIRTASRPRRSAPWHHHS